MTAKQRANLKQRIFQSLGEASMCWKPKPGNQVFDADHAIKIGNKLYKYVNSVISRHGSQRRQNS